MKMNHIRISSFIFSKSIEIFMAKERKLTTSSSKMTENDASFKYHNSSFESWGHTLKSKFWLKSNEAADSSGIDLRGGDRGLGPK